MNNVKTILISQFPLPYNKIGSWTTLYNNYITTNNKIDFIICPTPKERYNNVTYSCFSQNSTIIDKVKLKLKMSNKWSNIYKPLNKIISSDSKYIIQIIDNYGLITTVNDYLERKNLRKNCYIQFFYHGYKAFKDESFYQKVDEIVLLTHKSYDEVKKNSNVFPCYFSVLHNGIDTKKFYVTSSIQKEQLKREFSVQDKIVFVWCSQDRPKKGLHLILDVWKQIFKNHKNIELWVIGAEKRQNSNGVKYMGRIPNNELPKYYQAADVYLFPTLCQEGFGLSLIEAKHSGCYCIASAIGGVPEVLEYGKYGKLIDNPNFVSEWRLAIESYLKNNIENVPFPKDLYSKEVWNESMNNLILNAKKRII